MLIPGNKWTISLELTLFACTCSLLISSIKNMKICAQVLYESYTEI